MVRTDWMLLSHTFLDVVDFAEVRICPFKHHGCADEGLTRKSFLGLDFRTARNFHAKNLWRLEPTVSCICPLWSMRRRCWKWVHERPLAPRQGRFRVRYPHPGVTSG